MAFQGYPENQTYKPVTEAAFNLGRTVRAAKESMAQQAAARPAVPQYSNLANTVQASGATASQPLPEILSKLGRQSTGYGESTRYEGFHPAIDLATPTGTPLGSLTSGTVTSVTNTPSFGRSIIVKDQFGNFLRYSHLNQGWVKTGDTLKQGQPIGQTGRSGQVYSPSGGDPSHIDIRIWNAAKQYFNPATYPYS